jgi:hypothetical protein
MKILENALSRAADAAEALEGVTQECSGLGFSGDGVDAARDRAFSKIFIIFSKKSDGGDDWRKRLLIVGSLKIKNLRVQ